MAVSQDINTFPSGKVTLVINNAKQYRHSIRSDSAKMMVPLARFVKPLITTWPYADSANFTHSILYRNPEAYTRREIAIALQKVQKELSGLDLALTFYDAYRPYSVTVKMWKAVPDERYAANPAKGSNHNRGAAVDVSLVRLSDSTELPMPTAFDDFSERAHHDYSQLSAEVKANRALLKRVMEKHGFVALDTEWWHYSWPGSSTRFELLDLSFRQLRRLSRQ